MVQIFVVGSGVVGTATGRGSVDAGHNVTFMDVLESRVDQLSAAGFTARPSWLSVARLRSSFSPCPRQKSAGAMT
jgi:3-hydroxyisobutyrate dehydrogenase-like beta-hydroxyacid dehydrogenase